MDEELLLCKYCGGEVSSFAKTCPHCGSYNFHPDSYIKRRIIEEKERDRKYQEQIEKQKGPELRVEAVGDRCPREWEIMIEFDGRRFSQLATRTVQFSETDYPTHLRLVPGQHTVSYVNLELFLGHFLILTPGIRVNLLPYTKTAIRLGSLYRKDCSLIFSRLNR